MYKKTKEKFERISNLAKVACESYRNWLDRKDLLHEPTYDIFLKDMDKLCVEVTGEKPKGVLHHVDRY